MTISARIRNQIVVFFVILTPDNLANGKRSVVQLELVSASWLRDSCWAMKAMVDPVPTKMEPIKKTTGNSGWDSQAPNINPAPAPASTPPTYSGVGRTKVLNHDFDMDACSKLQVVGTMCCMEEVSAGRQEQQHCRDSHK
jgi:hypothetical protein